MFVVVKSPKATGEKLILLNWRDNIYNIDLY